MSQNQRQAKQQQQHHLEEVTEPEQQPQKQQQEQIAGIECKKKRNKNRNRKKCSEAAKNLSKEITENTVVVVGDSEAQGDKQTKENKPINNIMKQTITPVASRKAAGSNWETAMAKTTQPTAKNEQESNGVAANNSNGENVAPSTTTLTKAQRHRKKRRNALLHKYVAMDCEMVGVGLNGLDDMLARVSIVNRRGDVLLDKFVKPQERVVNYRTSVSGVRPHDMANGEDMATVQDEVVQILQGKFQFNAIEGILLMKCLFFLLSDKILIGHGINKDLSVLRIKHPKQNIRDTAFYKPLRRLMANGRTPSLKRLSQAILGKEIQTGEHSSVEDARAVMSIYNILASDWEQYIKRHEPKHHK